MKIRNVAAAVAAAIALQPAAAADLAGSDAGAQRSSAFAGATLRLGLDRHGPRAARPRLSLGISRVHERLGGDGRIDRFAAPGLELGLSGGRPLLMIGGETLPEARQRLGVNTSHAVLGIVGLSIAAFAAVELLGGGETEDDELNKKQCLLPEGCPGS